jgi:hypothetical protein
MKLNVDFTELTAVVAKMHGVTLEEMQKRINQDVEMKLKKTEDNASSLKSDLIEVNGRIGRLTMETLTFEGF